MQRIKVVSLFFLCIVNGGRSPVLLFFFCVCVCMGIEADDEKKKNVAGFDTCSKKKKKMKHQEKSDAWRSSSKCKQRDPLLFFFFFFFLILHLPPFFSGFPCSSSVLVDLLELPMPDLFLFFSSLVQLYVHVCDFLCSAVWDPLRFVYCWRCLFFFFFFLSLKFPKSIFLWLNIIFCLRQRKTGGVVFHMTFFL